MFHSSQNMITIGDDSEEDQIDILRHVTLDSLRATNVKFRKDYGQPILAIDAKNSWRRDIFPYYKANRKEARKDSAIDWALLMNQIRTIIDEIKENFPYLTIESPRAEADDIIGVLTREAISQNRKVMIVSGDKDFIQLQIGTDLVSQYDKRQDKYVSDANPKRYLFEHILRGDRGDGIPNIRSPGDSFVTKTRMKPMTAKIINEFWDDPYSLMENERFIVNREIIDLRFTPEEIKEDILNQYRSFKNDKPNNIKSYCIEHRMKKLYNAHGEFL